MPSDEPSLPSQSGVEGDNGPGLSADHAPAYVAELDENAIIHAINRIPPSYAPEQVLGTSLRRWLEPQAQAAFDRALAEVLATGEPRTYAWKGTESGRVYESFMTRLFRQAGAPRVVLNTYDITERRREQQALLEIEQRVRVLAEGAFEGLMLSVDGTIVETNAATARLLGCNTNDILGRTPRDFCTPESLPRVIEQIRSGSELPYEITALRLDGSTFACEVLGRNVVYQGKAARLTGFRDLTERKRMEREREELEEQMRQTQKLESLGVLAGGIAHDFNNVLMAVVGNAELALNVANLPAPSVEYLLGIRSAALSGRELTIQLLNYAARGPVIKQALNLSEVVRDTVSLIRVSISKKAELCLQLEPVALVEGDPMQLRQLVMNLVINASEALVDGGGRIEIQIERAQVTPADLEGSTLHAEFPSGHAVVLRVHDTGQGMVAATIPRIFDPFFTTKFTGRGLGLASVLSIVRGHRGAIRVTSVPGGGTQFTVWLAASDVDVARPASAPPEPVQTGVGLVLVADDEPALRNLMRELLSQLGFEVVVAEDGMRALEAFERHRAQLVLIVLDLTMPKLSGIEALRRIREQGSEVPVLCTSGYSSERLSDELPANPMTRFLAKPYSLAELTRAIDALLQAARGGAH